MFEPIHVDQTDQLGLSAFGVTVKGQFVDEALSPATVVGQDVFHVLQLGQMRSGLELAPAGEGAHLPAGEDALVPVDPFFAGDFRDEGVKQAEQSTRLRGQFVQAAPQHFMGNPVGRCDVLEGDLDVFQGSLAFDRSLMLVQQGDGADQREVFEVIAPGPRAVAAKGQSRRKEGDPIGSKYP